MRILVVGAGAVGGLFGGLMAAHDRDVTFLVRDARAAVLRRRGLELVGTAGGPQDEVRAVPVGVLTADELPGADPFDVVLLAVKAYGLDGAIPDIAPAVDAGAAVLPVLNGMRHIDVLADRFGADRVIGGFAFVSAYLDDRGRVATGPVAAALTYGELDGSPSDRIRRFHAAAGGCGFRATLSSAIRDELWAKWVFLASFAGLNVLTGGSVGQARAPGGPETARALLAEAAAVAQAAGHRPPADKLAADLAVLTAPDSDNRASLDKDRRAGRPVEAEAIIGDLVDWGVAAGVPVPLLQATRAALAVHAAGAG
ncbi:ketopantoate reductase family protein [Nakamurella sp.]|uniref:ketopantoate reductase family protein n=1 Tax=Nakamurella sp. TaxID=1869182 RepID=UPI003B3AA721